MNDDKQTIFSRLYGQLEHNPIDSETIPQWTSPPPHGELVDIFCQSVKDNHAQLAVINTLSELPQAVATYLSNHQLPFTIVSEQSLIPLPWQAANILAEHRAPTKEDECGITTILAADATTGAMLITDTITHMPTLSLLPPHHIAVIKQQSLYPSISEVLNTIKKPIPSLCNFICGPSRTADIEQEMVLGMHGPTNVLVILVKQ